MGCVGLFAMLQYFLMSFKEAVPLQITLNFAILLGSMKLNPQFTKFSKQYLFSEIERRKAELGNTGREIVNLGIGDVAEPLGLYIQRAVIEAVEEMGRRPIGYGPGCGYLFLKEKILEVEYRKYGFSTTEIFITEGINPGLCYVSDLFDQDLRVGMQDPTYPLYYDLSLLSGREEITKLPCLEENHFIPKPPTEPLDLIYLCSPNNPTGTAMTRRDLKEWVDYARKHGAILLFDAAYESFIQSKDVPRSIYEIEGAKEVALEFRSFSKSHGCTGLRIGYLVLPKETGLVEHFHLRQDIKTNGIAYPMQKAAMAALDCKADVHHYLEHAKELKSILAKKGFTCYGGVDSPYIWWKIPTDDSWGYFDFLLKKFHLITIPGRGFGEAGEGFIRLSCFLNRENALKAMERLNEL